MTTDSDSAVVKKRHFGGSVEPMVAWLTAEGGVITEEIPEAQVDEMPARVEMGFTSGGLKAVGVFRVDEEPTIVGALEHASGELMKVLISCNRDDQGRWTFHALN